MVGKHGRVLVLTEESATPSFAGAVQGAIQSDCFESLDAPVILLGNQNTNYHQCPILLDRRTFLRGVGIYSSLYLSTFRNLSESSLAEVYFHTANAQFRCDGLMLLSIQFGQSCLT